MNCSWEPTWNYPSVLSKNLENIWLGSQQISTLWMNKPLAATTTRKKCLPFIWYFINSELRFDLLMTPHSNQLDVGQVIQVFARRRIFLCQVGLATPPQKITTVISDHFSQHMLYNQDCTKYLHFNLMQCWVEHWSIKMSLPMEVPWRYCWESENFKFKIYSIAVLTFFHLHLTLKIRPLADLDSHTYLHSRALSSRNGRPLINVSSTNFYHAQSLFDFATSQELNMMSSVTLWLSIIAELISANH